MKDKPLFLKCQLIPFKFKVLFTIFSFSKDFHNEKNA